MLAIMLGRLRMTVQESITFFELFVNEVYGNKKAPWKKSKYSKTQFEALLADMIRHHNPDHDGADIGDQIPRFLNPEDFGNHVLAIATAIQSVINNVECRSVFTLDCDRKAWWDDDWRLSSVGSLHYRKCMGLYSLIVRSTPSSIVRCVL